MLLVPILAPWRSLVPKLLLVLHLQGFSVSDCLTNTPLGVWRPQALRVSPVVPPFSPSLPYTYSRVRNPRSELLAAEVEDGDGISKALNLMRSSARIYKELEKQVVDPDPTVPEAIAGKKNATKGLLNLNSTKPMLPRTQRNGTSELEPEAIQRLVQERLDAFDAKAKRTRAVLLKKVANWAYDTCAETKKDKKIDQAALYAGTLLVHLHLSKYVGVAACLPPTREQVDELFELADQDQSGHLNREEFSNAIVVACTPISIRVAIYWSLLTVLPIAVSSTMGGVTRLMQGNIASLPPGILKRGLSVVEWIIRHVFSILFFSILVPNLFGRVDRATRTNAKRRCASQNQSSLWWLKPQRSYLQRVGNSIYSLQDAVFGSAATTSNGSTKKSDEDKGKDKDETQIKRQKREPPLPWGDS
ncbi:expressed unknown protein [Seminavis robusta]|uniref:EF-hand domain-containing protein n=1 Tax=Seminavis robusta TaxID=568900 RepID=A0A9N8EGC0_9STRA|nr:expressed unknown protein [Seminavis robusta]|eukprot:Sro1038_g234260.1 n/a (417) ;mRNA; r:10711-11961